MKKLSLVAALLASAAAFAQTPSTPAAQLASPPRPPPQESAIKSGDPAPPLQIAEWLKGAPITRLEPGKLYLVEFWATWCGPCIGNIPHLNAMQAKHAKDGLVVIGFTNPDVAAGETTARKENNTLQQVRDFVARRTDMNYHVAYDLPNKATYLSLMGSKRSGIPHAFLFGRDGRLAVDFHPYYLDDAIQQVLAGTWDPVAGPKQLKRSSALYGEVLGSKTYADFQEKYGTMEKEFPVLARKMIEIKFDRVRLARDEREFLSTAQAMIATAREVHNATNLSSVVRTQLRPRPVPGLSTGSGALDLSKLTPAQRQQREEAAARAKQREEDEKTALKLPLDLLAQMADTACELSNNSDPAALAAKAEVAFARGDAKAAIALQTQAVALAIGYVKATEEKRLGEFQQARPAS